MHPVFVTAIAAAQRKDKLALAAAARQARSARSARPARHRRQPGASPSHWAWRRHGSAVLGTHARQKAGA
jgi:hypothetical protein